MKKINDAVDVVVVGLGWTGAIMSIELAKAGLKVRALERGADRPASEWGYPNPADELANTKRHVLMQKPSQDAFTVRHNAGETALPMRELGAFRLGDGVGGAGLHWTAMLIRPTPNDLKLKTFADTHYAKGQLDEELRIMDFPFTWDEIEPHFDFFDKVCGTSGTTGNLNGKILPGGDPFEGPRSNPFPTKALEDSLQSSMFRKAATELGYHPFSNPSAAVSEAWTNPYRQQIAPCNYCGFCQFYSCINYSKASPQTTILDALNLYPNFDYKTHAHVIRVEKHADGKTATGVTYIDAEGNEVFQPAKIVILASFALNNVRLLLNSKIGKPYNPITEEGVVGRNYAYQYGGGFTLFYDKLDFNPFATAGPTGVMFNDFGPGNFDASQLGFIGGAKMHSSQATGTPMASALKGGTDKWGAGWKKGIKESYGHSMGMKMTVSNMSTRGNFLDLDPNYTDQYGLPLLRMTYDFVHNDIKLMRYLRDKMMDIVKHLNPDSYTESIANFDSHFNISPAYSSTHNTGGAVMGDDPKTSVVNRYLQSWDVHNVFVQGACAFPQNFQANPTALVGALAYWSAKAIKEQYIGQPGPLVQV
ncbi:GMC family oxidoreductase [Candidatus Pantoea multigeneris]|uniref:GMC family oxidoreductase n=1 Tax=Candidatus Pantoea multigeneris TaxID=2608357 RepID=A0ABX0R5I2_9GAMM|nr:GMC family oxidoreductase [Pantoea multigeneris]NIF20352.1 GMC family oxidoreductase [Pantoea multigeneris]